MCTEYIRTFSEELKKVVIGFRGSGRGWIENSDGDAESVVDFPQLFSSKTATTHNGMALEAYL